MNFVSKNNKTYYKYNLEAFQSVIHSCSQQATAQAFVLTAGVRRGPTSHRMDTSLLHLLMCVYEVLLDIES